MLAMVRDGWHTTAQLRHAAITASELSLVNP